jgi:hypothetical protein
MYSIVADFLPLSFGEVAFFGQIELASLANVEIQNRNWVSGQKISFTVDCIVGATIPSLV